MRYPAGGPFARDKCFGRRPSPATREQPLRAGQGARRDKPVATGHCDCLNGKLSYASWCHIQKSNKTRNRCRSRSRETAGFEGRGAARQSALFQPGFAHTIHIWASVRQCEWMRKTLSLTCVLGPLRSRPVHAALGSYITLPPTISTRSCSPSATIWATTRTSGGRSVRRAADRPFTARRVVLARKRTGRPHHYHNIELTTASYGLH